MDIDPSTIVPQLVEDFENALGVVLKAGDQRREFLQGFGYVFTTALQQVEMTGEVNLLQYAYGTYLDKLGTAPCSSHSPGPSPRQCRFQRVPVSPRMGRCSLPPRSY